MEQQNAVSSPWRTVEQAADYTQSGPKTIYRAIEAGRLRAVRINGRRDLRIRQDWIDAWLESSRSGKAS